MATHFKHAWESPQLDEWDVFSLKLEHFTRVLTVHVQLINKLAAVLGGQAGLKYGTNIKLHQIKYQSFHTHVISPSLPRFGGCERLVEVMDTRQRKSVKSELFIQFGAPMNPRGAVTLGRSLRWQLMLVNPGWILSYERARCESEGLFCLYSDIRSVYLSAFSFVSCFLLVPWGLFQDILPFLSFSVTLLLSLSLTHTHGCSACSTFEYNPCTFALKTGSS